MQQENSAVSDRESGGSSKGNAEDVINHVGLVASAVGRIDVQGKSHSVNADSSTATPEQGQPEQQNKTEVIDTRPSGGGTLLQDDTIPEVSSYLVQSGDRMVKTVVEKLDPTSSNGNITSHSHPLQPVIGATSSPEATKPNSVANAIGVSEWSHQQLAPREETEEVPDAEEDLWQDMPAFATHDVYDDDGRLVARAAPDAEDENAPYTNLGGAAKGYTRVQVDEDAQSATSMDENTAYLFKEKAPEEHEDPDEQRDPLAQMQATKDLLSDNQKIAYVGVVRLALAEMLKDLKALESVKSARKDVDFAMDSMKKWSQIMMVRLYAHIELDAAEQMMIEQLADHGLQPQDLTPTLMANARVKNPVSNETISKASLDEQPAPRTSDITRSAIRSTESLQSSSAESPPPYVEHNGEDMPAVRMPSQLPHTSKIDIDVRWTVLCDLFLILISDSVYDARSRTLLERVGNFLDVPWLDICRFEKRVTDSLEMQEAANKENWDEQAHMESRQKRARTRRLVMMGLATVGGGLVIGLSAGLLAPVIGAGLAAGFTTIGVTGTGSFLAGAGGAAVIGTTGALTGGTVGVRAAKRRVGAVKTFEYRPLHNNKKVNLVVTVAGWMTGKVDDVRLPFSTIDPIMGDIYAVLWEPEMLRSMGDTINILATEALTSGLQQVLGSTILVALMSAIQLPMVLTKLSYLIDNPWSVSLARADLAGLILADSLIDRNLGARPITLVGFSLGSRVIFSCLRELAKRGAIGLVQNAYLFGSPIVAKKDEYTRARAIVSGRFVNGYATNDWILGYLFRATSGGIMRVAGLAKVEVPGVENLEVTKLVPGHMAYRSAMPRLMREVGWAVESDEFAEIEDPDPDNHEKRQRELIDEIEEARKDLQQKPAKKRFGLFRSKKAADKKEWETYEESKARTDMEDSPEAMATLAGGTLFDIDAIRREAVELAAQGVEVKQLETTLPTLRMQAARSDSPTGVVSQRPYLSRRGTKSYDGLSDPQFSYRKGMSSKSLDYDDYDESEHHATPGEEKISMSFDTSYDDSPVQTPAPRSTAPSVTTHHDHPEQQRSVSTHVERQQMQLREASPPRTQVPRVIPHNVWADDDEEEFGHEKEMSMTFE